MLTSWRTVCRGCPDVPLEHNPLRAVSLPGLMIAWGLAWLLVPQPVTGQTLPSGTDLGEIFSAALDSVSVRTNAFRGWSDGAIRLRIQDRGRAGEAPFEPATLEVLEARNDVVDVCTPSAAECEGGDYVMLTRFVHPDLVAEDTATVRVHLSGDDGARGDPDTGFAIGWDVTLVRDEGWIATEVELRIVTDQ